MAKKNDEKLNYQSVLRKLKEKGPQQLYLLWGPEDYLREHFLTQIKSLCLPDGDDSFSYKRLNGPELDAIELQQAVDAVPFLSDRTLVELRGVDLNRLKDTDAVLKALSDIAICVPSAITYQIQEYHLPVYHCLCACVENEIFGEEQ